MKLLLPLLAFIALTTMIVSASPNSLGARDDYDACLMDQQQLFTIINELKRENVQLQQARTNWRKNIYLAASEIRDLKSKVASLQETNAHWAQKINHIKLKMNAMKVERVREDMIKKKREELGMV